MSETIGPPNIIRNVIAQIPEELRREIANTLSEGRAEAGSGQADKLAQTAPEDRTWKEGLVAVGWGITDLFDGLLTEDLEPNAEGREADREGDRKFVMPQQKTLMKNGEIPPAHYKLKLFREGTMMAVRWWGARHG